MDALTQAALERVVSDIEADRATQEVRYIVADHRHYVRMRVSGNARTASL